MNNFFSDKIVFTAVVVFTLQLLTGCGSSEQKKLPVQQTVKKFNQATTLTGQVIGKDQALTSGSIKVTDSENNLLVSEDLQGDNRFQLEIPAGTVAPVIMTYFPKPDSLESEQMISVVIEPTVTRYDISPLTTAIAKSAKAMGGYTRSNMVMAAENRVNVPDANKTSTGFRGDPTKQYGGWH